MFKFDKRDILPLVLTCIAILISIIVAWKW